MGKVLQYAQREQRIVAKNTTAQGKGLFHCCAGFVRALERKQGTAKSVEGQRAAVGIIFAAAQHGTQLCRAVCRTIGRTISSTGGGIAAFQKIQGSKFLKI